MLYTVHLHRLAAILHLMQPLFAEIKLCMPKVHLSRHSQHCLIELRNFKCSTIQ